MRIDFKTLKHLSVETKSGAVLGHVSDIELDVESHLIAQYKVRSSILGVRHYLVSRTQVIAVTAEKIIVDDMVSETADAARLSPDGKINPKPVITRDEVLP